MPGLGATNSDADDSTDNDEPKDDTLQYHVIQSDSQESIPANNTIHPQQLTNPMHAHPDGSLLHHFQCPTSTPDEDADHILLWLDIMEGGPVVFEHEIAHNLRHTESALALFAILPEWSETVKLAHGFTSMLLTNG